MKLEQVQDRIEAYFSSITTEQLKRLLIEKYGFAPTDFEKDPEGK